MINIIGHKIYKCSDTYPFFSESFRNRKLEKIMMIGINNFKVTCTANVTGARKHQSAIMYVDDTFELLEKYNCDSFIVAHNHPRGTKEPSDIDITFTKELIKEGEAHGCKLLEHCIYSGEFWNIMEKSLGIKNSFSKSN